jgi:hypothetical protein
LTVNFDSSAKSVAISLPDKSLATKNTYAISAVFTHPGIFTFPFGLNLRVYDICDTSYFESPPTLSIDNKIYYAKEDALYV